MFSLMAIFPEIHMLLQCCKLNGYTENECFSAILQTIHNILGGFLSVFYIQSLYLFIQKQVLLHPNRVYSQVNTQSHKGTNVILVNY